MSILACVDGSRYAGAVCDYAAWFSSRMSAPITLLNVGDPARASSSTVPALARAVERLAQEGSPAADILSPVGDFAPVALDLAGAADVLVMGKRGRDTSAREALGSNVEAMVRGSGRPLCLVSQVYLPISHALVILDGDPEHRRSVEFVSSHHALRNLTMDLVLMSDGRVGADDKVQWARTMLNARSADVFAMSAQDPGEVATRYLENSGFDLLIISKEVLLSGASLQLRRIDAESLWAKRAPILVC